MAEASRTVILSRFPRNHVALSPDSRLICPGDIAARQLGRPPVSLDDVARLICESHGLTIAPEFATLRALAHALRDFLPTEDTDGIARTMLPAVNLLYREGVDLADLARRTHGRIHQIARAGNETRLRLRKDYMVSKSDAVYEAIELATRASKKVVTVYGFARLISAEYRFLDSIAGPSSRLYLPYQKGSALFNDNLIAAEFLAARGWAIETPDDSAVGIGQRAADAFLEITLPIPEVRAMSSPTIEDEVRCALRRIKSAIMRGEYGIEDVVIVARSETTYGPVVRKIAWEYGIPVRTHYTVSLTETRLGQWLTGLLEVCDPAAFPFEATARVAEHALGADLKQQGWSADDWKGARKDHTRGAEGWSGRHIDIEKLTWKPEQTRKEWCELLQKTIESLRIRELSMLAPHDIVACERLYDALREFALPYDEILTRQQFALQIAELLRITVVPSNLSRSGIELHTPLALFGAEVKHMFVLGAAEGKLPQPVADDPLLDFHERKQLAGLIELESAARAARRETLSFYSMILAAKETLTFSYTRLDGSSEARPSPFLKKIAAEIEHGDMLTSIAASEAELLHYQMAGETDAETDYTARARMARDVVLYRERGMLDIYSGQIAASLNHADFTFSPTQINTFGQCRYHWFAARLLRLGDPEEAEDDLAANLKGLLYHSTLQRGVNACKTAQNIRTAMLARLEQDFDAAASGVPELMRMPGWRTRRPELLDQLRKAIEADQFLVEGACPVQMEFRFKGRWHGLNVGGTLDRLDIVGNEAVVIDYKTSGSEPKGAKDADGKLKLDVQLPIYMSAGAAKAAPGSPVKGGYYYSLTKGEHLGAYNMGFPRLIKREDAPGLEALAQRIMVCLAEGTYPVDPDLDQDACAYCELDLLCRRGPHLARRREDVT